jgi:hypothetical protein
MAQPFVSRLPLVLAAAAGCVDMVAVAVAGAALLRIAPLWVPLIPLVLVAGVLAAAAAPDGNDHHGTDNHQ